MLALEGKVEEAQPDTGDQDRGDSNQRDRRWAIKAQASTARSFLQ